MNPFIQLKKVIPIKAFAFVYAVSAISLMAAERPSDDTIVLFVKNALFEDPRVRAADITVKSLDGIVILEGTVKTLEELQFADLEAKKIKGVLAVANKLAVKPVFRPDAEIRQDIRRGIIKSSMIKSENIGVRVENGVVFLTGTAESSVERKQMSLLASEVFGVKAVENRIEVTYKFQRPDNEIKKDALAKLANDVYLVGLRISVAVKKGFVTLSGEVGGVFEKERAENDVASLFNVIEVNNDLGVKLPKTESAIGEAKSLPDSVVTGALKDEIRLDGGFYNPNTIKINLLWGAITLTGAVPTYAQKRLAERDARMMAGAQWIDNLLQVKGVCRIDDGIYGDIREALAADHSLSRYRIDFYVNDGFVTLKGVVDSQRDKSRVENDIEGIVGINDVTDYIIVEWAPLYSDETLVSRISGRLAANWETSPAADRIITNVKDGRVTLTGTVDTRAQCKEAGIIAGQTDGVGSVDNRLAVNGDKQ